MLGLTAGRGSSLLTRAPAVQVQAWLLAGTTLLTASRRPDRERRLEGRTLCLSEGPSCVHASKLRYLQRDRDASVTATKQVHRDPGCYKARHAWRNSLPWQLHLPSLRDEPGPAAPPAWAPTRSPLGASCVAPLMLLLMLASRPCHIWACSRELVYSVQNTNIIATLPVFSLEFKQAALRDPGLSKAGLEPLSGQ